MTRQQINSFGRSDMRSIMRMAAPLFAVLFVLAGCSWVPGWANPMNAYDAVFGDDPPPPTAASEQDKQLATQQGSETFPSVGSVPDKPPQTSSATERRQVVKGLVADKQNARYTDSTTGQQVAAVPPPPPLASTSSTTAIAPAKPIATAPATQTASATPRPLSVPSIVQGGPQPIAPPQVGAPYPQTLVPRTAVPQPQAVVSAPPVPQPVVPSTIPQIAQPTASVVVPQLPTTLPRASAQQVAPTLSATPAIPAPGQYTTVAQIFAARLAESGATVTNAPAHLGLQFPVQQSNSLPLLARSGAGGSAMAQPVTTLASLPASQRVGLAGIGEPVVVKFPHGSARIVAGERAKVRDIAKRFQSNGGGVIRVVGHASSRTKNLPVDKHKLVNFWISMDRAQAVARELMRQGVSANAIAVEARSDSDPRFFEAMPAGEAENRRAEVYLEF